LAVPTGAQDVYDLADDDMWLLTERAEPGSPAARLALARTALAQREFARARDLADGWIEENERHELMPLALLTRADARVGLHDEYEALFDYEAIARLHPSSDVFVTALRRELDIAKRYAHGEKRKLWGLRIVNATDEAEELLIRIQERLPGSNLAEEAGLELGDFYFRRGEMSLAADAYDLFIQNYSKSPHLTTARRRLIAANLAAFKGPEFDATGLNDARQRLIEMKAVEPAAAQQLGADALLAGIDERHAEKMLETVRWYLSTGDAISADYTLRRLLEKHERSAAAIAGLRLSGDILDRLTQALQARVEPFYAEKSAALLGTPAVGDDTTEGGG